MTAKSCIAIGAVNVAAVTSRANTQCLRIGHDQTTKTWIGAALAPSKASIHPTHVEPHLRVACIALVVTQFRRHTTTLGRRVQQTKPLSAGIGHAFAPVKGSTRQTNMGVARAVSWLAAVVTRVARYATAGHVPVL